MLFFSFFSDQNLYMIHHDMDLFYDIYNTINEYNRRQTHYFPFFLNCFDIFFHWFKKPFYNFICIFIIISLLLLFEYITCSSSISSLDETKLIAISSWIAHAPNFLRSFIISFKSGLILLRYPSTDSVFLWPLVSYLI